MDKAISEGRTINSPQTLPGKPMKLNFFYTIYGQAMRI